jgi:hypothetical protein
LNQSGSIQRPPAIATATTTAIAMAQHTMPNVTTAELGTSAGRPTSGIVVRVFCTPFDSTCGSFVTDAPPTVQRVPRAFFWHSPHQSVTI